jgi:hypothetical protein
MYAGLAVAFTPFLLGLIGIERWRRRTTRALRQAESRSHARRAAWDAVAELRRAA